MSRLAYLVAIAGVMALCWPVPAGAIDPHRQYEEDFLQWARARAACVPEPRPEGKRIARIDIVREDIIAQSDPWPNFVNYLHVKTRDHVVRQELLIAPGQTWDPARIEESARNLRELFILAIVRTAACKAADPGAVVLLVATKDLWSIRLNMQFLQVGTVLQTIDFAPTEMNFLGRNKAIGLHVGLKQFQWQSGKLGDRLEVGQLYVDRRLFGTRLAVSEQLDLLIAGDVPCGGASGGQAPAWCPDRALGDVEGVSGFLRLQRPLFSLSTKWAFDVWAQAIVQQVRRYVVNPASGAPLGEQPGLSLRTDTEPDNPLAPAVPRVYDARKIQALASVTRSYGLELKHDLTTGLSGYTRRYEHPESFPFTESTLQWHARSFLPRSEDALYWFLRYRSRNARYLRLRNIQGFALTEDFPLGHDVSLESRLALDLADASHSFVHLLLDARYRWYAADDLLSVWLSAQSRLQPGLEDLGYRELDFRGAWANTRVEIGLKNVSPRILWGRLHVQARARVHDNDLDRTTLFLGGDSGLRGYPAEEFEGAGLFLVNLEYRSRPLNLWTIHTGCVLFYDGGGVFGGQDPRDPRLERDFSYHHSVGMGVRAQIPQFDKESLRVDLAFPLSSARGDISTWFSFAFRQAF